MKEIEKVIPLALVLLFASICIPKFCFADSIFNTFSEDEKFRLNYRSLLMVVNITSGTTTEKSSKGWYVRCRVYDQYINLTETNKKWYTVDESRRINGTDTRVLWWIDTDVHRGDTVRILDDSFTVVGKGVQELRRYSGAVRECWILVRDNAVAYYDTEFGLLINLINITQVEGDTAYGILLYFSSPGTPNMEVIRSTSMAARFYTSFPPLITVTCLVSVFVLRKYHIPKKVREWLRRIKR